MAKQHRGYLSYLLRMWRTGSEGQAVWRASLENPFTGERKGFANLKDLVTFLQNQTDAQERRELTEDERREQSRGPGHG